jgi:hypothetical protein
MTIEKSNEIIVVLYSGDLAILYYQALSITKFWKGDKHITYVIEDNSIEIKQHIEKYILPCLPDYTTKILFPPEELKHMDGWHRQQILKLWTASVSERDYSVILDVKNILIRPYSFNETFQDEKLLIQLHHNDHIPDDDSRRWRKVCQKLGIDYSEISKCYSITPFFWDNNIVRDLFSFCQSKNIDYFDEDFIKDAFEAGYYWAFAQNKIPYMPCMNPVQIGQYGGVGSEYTLSHTDFTRCINQAKDFNYPIFSMHRFHFEPNNIDSLQIFLNDLGLLPKNSEFFINDSFEFFKYSMKKSLPYLRPEVQNYMIPRYGKSKIIEINGKTIKVNRVVFYGCSFTAGDELADYDLLSHLSCDKIDKEKRLLGTNKFVEKYYVGKVDDKQHLIKKKRELESVWACKLAKKLDLSYINKATSGNSNQGIIFDIEKDLANNLIYDTDLVIVALTSEQRWLYFDKDGRNRPVCIGWEKFWPNSVSYKVFVENFANDNFILYNNINAIKYLSHLSHQFLGRLLIQTIHWDINGLLKWYKGKQVSKEILTIGESLKNIDCWIDIDLSFSKIVDWEKDTLGFYHPKQAKQDEMADLLFQRFKINE